MLPKANRPWAVIFKKSRFRGFFMALTMPAQLPYIKQGHVLQERVRYGFVELIFKIFFHEVVLSSINNFYLPLAFSLRTEYI